MIRSVRASVHVDEPPQVVWRAATDWTRQRDWMVGTEVHVIAGAGGPGSRLAAFTGVGGVGVLDVMDVVGWDPPRSCRVAHAGGFVRGAGGFDVAEVRRGGGAAALFTWWEEFELPAVAGPAWPFVRPAVVRGLRCSLDRFARHCRGYREEEP